jgi:hypothetical protein
VNNTNYGTTHYAKVPNIQFFVLLPFLVHWGVKMKIKTRGTARLEALNFRVWYEIQHNLPHVRILVENDALHLSDMLDSEITKHLEILLYTSFDSCYTISSLYGYSQ